MAKLKIREAREDDVFEDIARVNQQWRKDATGRIIPAGTICRLTASGGSALAVVRGLHESEGPIVRLDLKLRERLGVRSGDEVELKIVRVGFFGALWWAWHASEPASRIASRLAVLSVALGGIGLLLGIISLVK